jgi:hypothetical protein
MMTMVSGQDAPTRPAFGAWLVQQKGRDGAIGELAAVAATDRTFPRAGKPDDVRLHLNKQQADPMLYEVVDDAETDWLCL